MASPALLVLCSAFLIATGFRAVADEVRLTNGDTVHGKDLTLSQGVLKMKSPSLGDLSIPKEKIVQITTEGRVWVIFTDKRKAHAVMLPAGDGYMTLDMGAGAAIKPFTVEEIDTIASGKLDPEEVAKLWKTTGGINVGATRTTGNTKTTVLHADGQITAKRGTTRYTGRGEINYRKETEGDETNNALLQLKHDHFFTKTWFFYTNGEVQHDSEKSLRLRTSLGTGTGYQIYETDRTDLSIEGGLSYVNEDYTAGSDHSYPALRWSTDFRYDPWLQKIRLFHYDEIFGALAGHNGVLVRTRTGLRYFVTQGLNATAQMNFDWDSHPAPGQVESDVTYLVTLGYAW